MCVNNTYLWIVMCYLLTCLYKIDVFVSIISVYVFVCMQYSCRVYQNINMYILYVILYYNILYYMFHIVLVCCWPRGSQGR